MNDKKIYKKALQASWDLAWYHKSLWIFGLFAAFLGQMGLMEIFSKVGVIGTRNGFLPAWFYSPDLTNFETVVNSLAFSMEGWLLLVWMAVLFGGIAIVFLFVSVASQGALIDSAAQFIKKEDLPDASTAWHAGTNHFWRLLAVQLIKKVTIFSLAVIVGFTTYNAAFSATFGDQALFIVLLVSAILIGMVISFLTLYASCYVVVEEVSLSEAITAAAELFIEHWLVSIEIGVTILAINLLLALGVFSSLYILFVPTLMLWTVAAAASSSAFYYLGIIAATLLFVLFVAFILSVFKVFTTSAWTYLFMKMHHHGIVSRILHWSGLHKLER
jgi:hypothetical protein